MKLARVEYGLFSHEVDGAYVSAAHDQLDGEVRVTFIDEGVVHISWGNGPPQYCIEFRREPFFSPGVLTFRDVSAERFWPGLVGEEVTFHYIGEDKQVLQLLGPTGAVYLSSQYDASDYLGDSVRVSDQHAI